MHFNESPRKHTGRKLLFYIQLDIETSVRQGRSARLSAGYAKAGVPLARLDEKTGAVYPPIASDHKNQNERLMPFIEKRVKVTGTVVTKGGMTGIVIKTLAPVPAI